MEPPEEYPLVHTVSERCRVCYTCVRECPAKAIRILEGQAQVLPNRCIGCGNCVSVCSQHAKVVRDSTEQVAGLLGADAPVAAIVAPSFPAEFDDIPWHHMVSMVRALGFDYVNEVAFGAGLVAGEYRRLLAESPDERFIATSCPALVAYVEQYHPDLVDRLAPIVSPMVATARVLHHLHGTDLRIVFIGPCIAKKAEAASVRIPGEVDSVLTFVELRTMWERAGISPQTVAPGDFDPPHGGDGALFAITRGLLQTARIQEDLIAGEVVSADGRTSFVDAIRGFESGDMDARLLEVLCCNGCITGAGMSRENSVFRRRTRVSHHVRETLNRRNGDELLAETKRYAGLDLRRSFAPDDQRIRVPYGKEIAEIMVRMGKFRPEDELNCGACGYDTCREHAVAMWRGMAESEMCLPHTIEQLRKAVKELAVSNDQLASTQEALMQSERLASMGQLAAGIAHEVNNPLGVVLMYAHLLLDQAERHPEMSQDLQLIVDQADRCKKIVAGLLHFARQNRVMMRRVDIGELVGKTLKAYRPPESVTVVVDHETGEATAELDPDQITQVLGNLVTNACAAMPDGGTLRVVTACDGADVRFVVEDTGIGIPEENQRKIFEPFFSTKQIGKGTGLGLSISYGIVKMHGGTISVRSNADPAAGPTGSTFTVVLPRRAAQEAMSLG